MLNSTCLSKDTVLLFLLLVSWERGNAPRRIFLDPADLPPGKSVALITLHDTVPGDVLNKFKIGEEIYKNPQAVIGAYRTPGRAPLIGPLNVVKLVETE
jgi:hypothetical protein